MPKPAFNIALFGLAQLGDIGTARHRFFYGPGIDDFDIALEKAVRLTESKSMAFRIEAFDVFNHAQFYGPAAVNGDINSARFGQVATAAAPTLVQVAAKFFF